MISGDLEPTHQQFQIMAKFLNVTEDCLAGKTRFAVVEPGAGELTNDTERELVGIYRDLNTTGQSVLMGTARSLSMNPDMSANYGHVFDKKV